MTRPDETALAVEEQTLRAFVHPSRRDRLGAVVRTKKRYSEIVSALSHGHPWDERYVTELPVSEQFADPIHARLRALGAPDTCHVLGGHIDGQDLPLREALNQLVGTSIGALVICIPGRLAYHEGEERHDRNILAR